MCTGSDPIGKLKQSKFSRIKAKTSLVGPCCFSSLVTQAWDRRRHEIEVDKARGRGQASCGDGDHEIKKGGCTPVLLLLMLFYCPAAVLLHLWHQESFNNLQDFTSSCSGSDWSSTSDRTSSTGMMSEVSESLLMEGWCSPETTKNITNNVLPPNLVWGVIFEYEWKLQSFGGGHMAWKIPHKLDYFFYGVFCPFWILADLFTVLISSNKSYKLTKRTDTGYRSSTGSDQSCDGETRTGCAFICCRYQKKWPKYMRAESRSHKRPLELTKIIKSRSTRCVGQCERWEFHLWIKFLLYLFLISILRTLHYAEKIFY